MLPKKTKSVLYVMKRILYDMGHLTVAKCCKMAPPESIEVHSEGVVPQILG